MEGGGTPSAARVRDVAILIPVTTTAAPTALMIDGHLVPRGEVPRVPLDDGLVRGDGVFEGMRLYDRRPRTPGEHLDRLARSAEVVGLEIDRGLLERELAEFARLTADPDCGVRLMVTRGGRRIWREEALPPRSPGLRLLPVPHRVTPLLVGAKTLSYGANMQAKRRAAAAGCDDALLVRADDDVVLEGPTTAFAWIEGETLVFPPPRARRARLDHPPHRRPGTAGARARGACGGADRRRRRPPDVDAPGGPAGGRGARRGHLRPGRPAGCARSPAPSTRRSPPRWLRPAEGRSAPFGTLEPPHAATWRSG